MIHVGSPVEPLFGSARSVPVRAGAPAPITGIRRYFGRRPDPAIEDNAASGSGGPQPCGVHQADGAVADGAVTDGAVAYGAITSGAVTPDGTAKVFVNGKAL